MLQCLDSMAENCIFILDDTSITDFDDLPKKTTFLFVSSEFAAAMKDKLEQVQAVFVLEKDISKVDYRERFDNGDDLIFQLADEIYKCYKTEAQQHIRTGDLIAAKTKEGLANQIHSELKKAYNSVFTCNHTTLASTDPATTLVLNQELRKAGIKNI